MNRVTDPSKRWRPERTGRRIVAVSFGESEDGVSERPMTHADLRAAGFRKVKAYNHGTRKLGTVATVVRWERGTERSFSRYRTRDDVPVPLLFSDAVRPGTRGVRATIRSGDGYVFLSESHSDAEALQAAGVCGTTHYDSASRWSEEDAEQLRGADVIVVRHRDEAGRTFARDVVRSLKGRALSVRVVEPAVGSDVREHLKAGRTLDQLVAVRR